MKSNTVHPALARAAELLRQHGVHNADLEQAVADELAAFTLDAPARVARYLIDVAPRSRCAHGASFEVAISQTEVARYLGLSRSYVCTLLAAWRRSGLLAGGRALCVRRPAELRRITRASLAAAA